VWNGAVFFVFPLVLRLISVLMISSLDLVGILVGSSSS